MGRDWGPHAQAVGGALLDRYVAAVDAHDISSFPELFCDSYIQQDHANDPVRTCGVAICCGAQQVSFNGGIVIACFAR